MDKSEAAEKAAGNDVPVQDPLRDPPWDHAPAQVIEVTVSGDDVDRLEHVNNVTYLRWLEDVAWAHSESVGLDFPACQRLGVACVARRHELDYLGPAFQGERLAVATWVAENDGRLSLWRRYQIIRLADAKTLLRARTHWVCARLDNGKPCRMPEEFKTGYAVTPP
jgi:acyl-CoA thioester hydrolase